MKAEVKALKEQVEALKEEVEDRVGFKSAYVSMIGVALAGIMEEDPEAMRAATIAFEQRGWRLTV